MHASPRGSDYAKIEDSVGTNSNRNHRSISPHKEKELTAKKHTGSLSQSKRSSRNHNKSEEALINQIEMDA